MRLKASDLHVVMAQRSIPKLGNGTIVSSGNIRAARTGPKVLSPRKANPVLTTGLSEAASSLGSSRQGESSIAATADDGRGRRADERPAPGNSERFIQPGRFRQMRKQNAGVARAVAITASEPAGTSGHTTCVGSGAFVLLRTCRSGTQSFGCDGIHTSAGDGHREAHAACEASTGGLTPPTSDTKSARQSDSGPKPKSGRLRTDSAAAPAVTTGVPHSRSASKAKSSRQREVDPEPKPKQGPGTGPAEVRGVLKG